MEDSVAHLLLKFTANLLLALAHVREPREPTPVSDTWTWRVQWACDHNASGITVQTVKNRQGQSALEHRDLTSNGTVQSPKVKHCNPVLYNFTDEKASISSQLKLNARSVYLVNVGKWPSSHMVLKLL